jgi:hypothetical protein
MLTVEEIKDGLSCPARWLGVLYECVTCSQNNYPTPTKSTSPNPVETNNKIKNVAEQPVGVVSQRLVMVGKAGRFQTKRYISPLNNGKIEMSPELKVGDYLYQSTAKKQWIGLTDDDIGESWMAYEKTRPKESSNHKSRLLFARTIEAKLKEKNA